MISPFFLVYLVFMTWAVAALIAGLACVVMAATWFVSRLVYLVDAFKNLLAAKLR